MDAETSQIALLKECLQKQLDELTMLQSIYCNPGELQLQDHSTIVDMTEFLNGKSPQINSKLAFTVSIVTEGRRNKVQINIDLPHLYPGVESAVVVVRSGDFGQGQQKAIKVLVEQYIATECDNSDTYIFQVVSWIQDQLDTFYALTGAKDPDETKSQDSGIDLKQSSDPATIEYERLWIYSHHIKSKTKRQNIIKEARNLRLTGFLRPGKPGIICVEGLKGDTQEFWRIIKQWQWHKIQVRHSEVKVKQAGFKFNRFEDFREQLFTTKVDGDDEEVPMDMSLFMKYLEQHSSEYIKEYLFGF